MKTYELNLDGLVGPTHHYAGLSLGNLASTNNARKTSNPQAAALQGLQKMRLLHQLGLQQGILPPHQRPDLTLLQTLGFNGPVEKQLKEARRIAPDLLSAAYSASSMWAANAATVSSSHDTRNGRVHFTPANLITNLHRSNESLFSGQLLQHLFSDPDYFEHHSPLPQTMNFADEGAANHSRLCHQHSQQGITLWVYGQQDTTKPTRFPRRQTLQASEAIARSHGLDPNHVVFACQNPIAIEAGVFHNDVISVANESLFLVHEHAFLNQKEVLTQLKNKAHCNLQIIEVTQAELPLQDAVQTYLFNAQVVSLPNQTMALIAPMECHEHSRTHGLIQTWLSDPNNPIQEVHYLDLKQSMRNGGGPACLRLRVPLQDIELKAMHQGVLVNEKLLNALDTWVTRHYRTELSLDDLLDPALIDESKRALDELTQLLHMGSIYPFQR